jgi:serine/threonine-protein kinase
MSVMIGQVLNDRYEILEKIGEGGMAVAYRGRDRVLGRAVAIKVMRPELAADGEFLARFRREARAAAGIIHEHIAAVYDTGSDGPYHYIVMEYVPGESLKARLQRGGPLPLEEALRIATATAEALEAAHSAGVIHRDIKPHNILLGSEGQVKVTDFGIARAMSGTGNTETGMILGSVNYVSPEQARGGAVGPQSDLYSLGVTLFEMLTGRPPFDGGERLAIVHKHIYDRPPRANEFRPGLPHEVGSIIALCLEKEFSRRFASARELLNYLGTCPREEHGTWRPGIKRGWMARLFSLQWVGVAWRLRRRVVAAAILIVLLAGALVAVTLWASSRGRGNLVEVPDIVGMSGAAGQQYLKRLGLDYRVIGKRESEETEVGSVLLQDPAANELAPRLSVVKVVVSEGPKTVAVPNVTQMSVAQAKKNLAAAGLESGLVQEAYDERVPASYIASTLPSPGARVVRGTAVDLVVSLGPRPAMPPGPPLPGPPKPEREEKLDFQVPSDVGLGDVDVMVETVDDKGHHTIYEGHHKAGEKIPTQTVAITAPVTVRVLVNGQLRSEHRYQP